MRTRDVLHVLKHNLDGQNLQVELLVDLEGLLEHLVADRNLSDGGPVEVVQAVDVVLHARLVGLDRRDDQQVLQVVVVAEAAGLEDDLLQQLDQLRLQPGCHEGLDRHRHLLRVLRLWQSRRHHLQ